MVNILIVDNKIDFAMSLINLLNKNEKAVLKIIIKNARNDFFRINKYIFVEDSLDGKEVLFNESTLFEYEDDFEYNVEIDKIENVFEDEKIYNIVRALTYNEKSVLYFYYVEDKSDKEIAKIMFSTAEAIRSKRRRIINKIRKEVNKNV